MKKKVLIVICIVLAAAMAGFVYYWNSIRDNRNQGDMKVHFDRAVICLPNGESVEGPVLSWQDYSDSDAIQITMGGKTYMTHYSNVCLIDD